MEKACTILMFLFLGIIMFGMLVRDFNTSATLIAVGWFGGIFFGLVGVYFHKKAKAKLIN